MRVAIADDDSDIIDFLGKIVEGQGHVYTGYADGTSLSNALLRDTFDLVILDWNMPGKNGMQILEWMESAVEDRPPVIMMTSRTAKQDISDAGRQKCHSRPDQCPAAPTQRRVGDGNSGRIWRLFAQPDRTDGQA